MRGPLLCLAAMAGLLVACGRSYLDQDQHGAGEADSGLEATTYPGIDAQAFVDAPGPDVESADSPAPPQNPCNPTTCPRGCCQPDGTCVIGVNNAACGIGGEACVACAPDEQCGGTCERWQMNCGPSNCEGCCRDALTCATGINDVACGLHGQMCERCVPAEGTGMCVRQADGGGLCNGVQSCTAANCGGCCEGNVCLVGLSQDHCGNVGAPCVVCPPGNECVSAPGNGGQCAPVATCGPASCPGCCTSEGVCAMGNQSDACGSGGAACQDCTPQRVACVSGRCQ